MERVVKNKIVSSAPTPAEEEKELSQGMAPGVGLVGTPQNGRFFKDGLQRYVQVALAEEPVNISISGDFIQAKYGNTRNINIKIGFSWDVKGSRRSTLYRENSAWGNLIQMWEDGGSYIVYARGNYDLNPQFGVYTPIMLKNISGRKMVKNSYMSSREILKKNIARDIKNAVRRNFT